MVAYRILFMVGAAAALPLNINLGAYSPALVVGKILTWTLLSSVRCFANHSVRQQVMVKLASEVIKMCPA